MNYYKGFAYIPTKISSDEWVWLKNYYIAYKIVDDGGRDVEQVYFTCLTEKECIDYIDSVLWEPPPFDLEN